MKTNNNIPAYRFQGYTDTWELRKLGEIARFRRGSFPQPYGNSEWYDGDGAMPFVQVADVTDEMNLVGDTKQKISKKAQLLSVYAEKGSVLVTLQGSIGRVAITQYGAFIDRTVLIFENFYLPIDNLFWAYVIKQKFIEEAKSAPGGTIKTITKEVLSDFNIKLPTYSEQSAIGTFFSTLDSQITLHQRKLDTLKEQKKTYLKLLFPAKGQTKPALRFQGFEDDWEEVKLGEVIEQQIREVDKPNDAYRRLSVRSHAKGTFHQLVEDPSTVAMDKLYVVKADDLIVNITFAWEHAIAVTNLYDDGLLVSHRFPTYRAKFNSDITYIKYLVSQEDFRRKLEFISPGGAGRNRVMNKKDFINLKADFPTLPEQEAIGTFFQTLDQEMTQVEDKLASFKEMKKTLLRKLFVSWGMRSYHALPMSRSPSGTFLDCLSSQAVRREFF